MNSPNYNRWLGLLGCFLTSLALMATWRSIAALLPNAWIATPNAQLAWMAVVALLQAAALDWLLNRSALRIRVLNDLSRELSQPNTVPTMLDRGLRAAVRLLGAKTAALRLCEERGQLVLSSVYNLPGDYSEEFDKVDSDHPGFRLPLHAAEPTVLDRERMPPDIAAMHKNGVVTAVVAPVVSHGQVHGVLILAYDKRRPITRNDLEALRAVGTQLGNSLAHRDLHDRLRQEAQTDALTGLASRRHFEDLYRHELARARRSMLPVSLAVIDIDRFKEINDEHGHPVGDQVLKVVAQSLMDVRGGDVVARYGGDEFVVLMPETRRDDADRVAQRVRERIHKLNESELFGFPIEVSIGVAQLGAPGTDLLEAADQAMYAEKQAHNAAHRAPRQPTLERQLTYIGGASGSVSGAQAS